MDTGRYSKLTSAGVLLDKIIDGLKTTRNGGQPERLILDISRLG